jgi:hypothetical protein
MFLTRAVNIRFTIVGIVSKDPKLNHLSLINKINIMQYNPKARDHHIVWTSQIILVANGQLQIYAEGVTKQQNKQVILLYLICFSLTRNEVNIIPSTNRQESSLLYHTRVNVCLIVDGNVVSH